ncbi:hypothetical protein MTO96_022267 [Rhipicephalus appendiculatus]
MLSAVDEGKHYRGHTVSLQNGHAQNAQLYAYGVWSKEFFDLRHVVARILDYKDTNQTPTVTHATRTSTTVDSHALVFKPRSKSAYREIGPTSNSDASCASSAGRCERARLLAVVQKKTCTSSALPFNALFVMLMGTYVKTPAGHCFHGMAQAAAKKRDGAPQLAWSLNQEAAGQLVRETTALDARIGPAEKANQFHASAVAEL